jgi:hypothetical protein
MKLVTIKVHELDAGKAAQTIKELTFVKRFELERINMETWEFEEEDEIKRDNAIVEISEAFELKGIDFDFTVI